MLNLIAGLAAIVAIAFSTLSVMNSTDEAISINKEAKQILAIDKQRSVNTGVTNKIVKNTSQLKNIKLSSLAVMPSTKDALLLDKLQQATKVAIVDNKIEEPDCNDLADTGKITLEECSYIAYKQQDYISISNGVIKMPDNAKTQKIASSINTMSKSKSSIDNNTSSLSITNKASERVATKTDFVNTVKAAKDNLKLVEVSNDPDVDSFLLEKVIQNSPNAPTKSLEIAKSIDRKIQQKTTVASSTIDESSATTKNVAVEASTALENLTDYVSLVKTVAIINTPDEGNMTDDNLTDVVQIPTATISTSNLKHKLESKKSELKSFGFFKKFNF